jgi:glutathione S-transferase
MKLIIGNTNYSSWSLRAWLAARQTGIPFEEVLIDPDGPDTHEKIRRHSPTGRVPVLTDGDITVWDSLAIAEYLAEQAPDAGLLPRDREARARARSIMAEVHSGFSALRNHCPMNIRRPVRPRPPSEAVDADVHRITKLWADTRARFANGGP